MAFDGKATQHLLYHTTWTKVPLAPEKCISHASQRMKKARSDPLRAFGFGEDYCLMTQTLISGCTSACRRMGTR